MPQAEQLEQRIGGGEALGQELSIQGSVPICS